MLAKCANPECFTTFLYLRKGKLFRIQVDASSVGPPSLLEIDSTTKKPPSRIEFFWLCPTCAEKMTVISANGAGINIRPLDQAHIMAS